MHDAHAHHHHHANGGGSPAGLATSATLHCLTGCAVGEFAGLSPVNYWLLKRNIKKLCH